MPLLAAFFAAAASVLVVDASSACPSCPIGRTARQRVIDDDFGTNLAIALAPFLLIGLAARRAERIES